MSHKGVLAEEPLEQQTGVKRRASGDLDQEAKKQRTSPGKRSPSPSQQVPEEKNAGESEAAEEAAKAEPTANDGAEAQQVKEASEPPSPESQRADEQKEPRKRRAGAATDERQRSKRLFGALFGGGAGGADRSGAKNGAAAGDRIARRRSEIEQRRKAELQKQDDERIEDRQKRLARLAIHRRKEQINVDERNMRTRHKNMLFEAEHLRTRAIPQVFYRPWELSAGEDDQIADQISDAQEQIDKELADFERQRELRLQAIEKSAIEVVNRPNPVGRQSPEGERSESQSESKMDEKDDEDTGRETHGLEPAEGKPTDNPIDDENAKDKTTSAGKSDAPASENKTVSQTAEEVNDEEDHVVEGDEDDVIY